MANPILEIRGLSKQYPGVRALDGVSFDVRRGTVHCIIGENGAGKSTLIKILTGATPRSDGEIRYNGRSYRPRTVRDAMDAGMGLVYQELNVIDPLTVAENLTLGREASRLGVIQKDPLADRVLGILRGFDDSIDATHRVSELSVVQKQIVEITKAIACGANVLVMDEPTASLSEYEAHKLIHIVRGLRTGGVTVIYISHRLEEVLAIGDAVTVLRDGSVVGTKQISEITDGSELVRMMTGRMVAERYVPSEIDTSRKVLEVQGVSTSKVQDVSFELRRGEILGFYGLVGSGKTEIARAVYRADRITRGTLKTNGRTAAGRTPRAAIAEGIALLPEERRTEGLFETLTIRENVSVTNVKKFSRFGITSRRKEARVASAYLARLSVAARNAEQTVASLSGGNQQKVVVAKCLNSDSNIILMDEPSRGVDVGAKEEMHEIIRELSRQGKSIVVFSSELPEILNLCDRIILMHEGKIQRELANGELDAHEIMRIVTGGRTG
jgi:ABC-type sugar transport system ATPase subunit